MAFITNKNNPSVTTVIGKVRKMRMGFINTLRMINKMETNMADEMLLTSTPGMSVAIKKIARAVENTFTRNCIRQN